MPYSFPNLHKGLQRPESHRRYAVSWSFRRSSFKRVASYLAVSHRRGQNPLGRIVTNCQREVNAVGRAILIAVRKSSCRCDMMHADAARYELIQKGYGATL